MTISEIISLSIFKTGYRSLRRHKALTFLSLLGFTVGLTCFILLFSFYNFETSYDSFHNNYERIYRVNQVSKGQGEAYGIAKVSFPLGPTLVNDYPGVVQTRLYQTFRKTPFLVNRESNTSFSEDKLFFTDSTFFDVFSYKLKIGNPKNVLKNPGSIVLTEETSEKIFGKTDPINKVLWLEGKMPFTVTGVLENVPSNSHLQFNMLASLQNIGQIFEATGNTFSYEGWYWTAVNTYITIPEGTTQDNFDKQLEAFKIKNLPESYDHIEKFYLQPIKEIHIGSNLSGEVSQNRSKSNLLLFLYTGIIILLIVVINYVNITTSQSLGRIKELNVKRTLGASHAQLMFQIISESSIIVTTSFLLSLTFAIFLTPWFNNILSSGLTLTYLVSPTNLLLYLILIVIISISAGLYPAYHTVKIMSNASSNQGVLTRKNKNSNTKKALVVIQFGVSSLMILFTIVIYSQYKLLMTKELGFDKEEVFMVPIRGSEAKNQITLFKEKLLNSPSIVDVSTLSDVLGQKTVHGRFQINNSQEEVNINMLSVDFDFFKTFDVSLFEGRLFDVTHSTDSIAYVINQSALKLFPNQSWLNGTIDDGPVIGVVHDFHYSSLLEPIQPLLLRINPDWANYLAIKIKPKNTANAIEKVESTWGEFEPYRPLNGFFLNRKIQQTYVNEEQLGILLSVFSMIALILACLGLFSLVNYTVKKRLKEVSIRKVLGSSTSNLYFLLIKDFLKLVIIAIVFSFPIGFFLIRDWLTQFPYKIEISPLFFVISLVASVIIALLSISYSAFKVAYVNPADILHQE